LKVRIFKRNNIDQKIALSIFEPCFFVSHSPSLIEFAFCGAVECSLEDGVNITLTYNSSVPLGDFVAAPQSPPVDGPLSG
jgi:hypothetical protein